MELAPSADDVWLKAMSLMNGVPVKQANSVMVLLNLPHFIPLGIAQAGFALYEQMSSWAITTLNCLMYLPSIICYDVFEK